MGKNVGVDIAVSFEQGGCMAAGCNNNHKMENLVRVAPEVKCCN
jgi:outer membrane murein-binding lipoprotein Lpp